METNIPSAYVAYTRNEAVRRLSSSGGLFSVCADWILNQHGVVFGAAFDNQYEVHHISIESKEQLQKLRGSKYLQSRIENTYSCTKKLLESGRMVLYSGTACQIAGLKAYLNKEFKNLYTIDVLCHGVPSPILWKKYLLDKQQKNGSIINNVDFRNKDKGWKLFSIKLLMNDNSCYQKDLHEDIFMGFFLSNICLRPSCHKCRFKDIKRSSDITLGDAWGVGDYLPEMDDDMGTSIVLTHSEKGKTLLSEISDELIIKEVELERALPPTADSRKSVKAHPNRSRFFKLLQKGKSMHELENVKKITRIDRVKNKIRNGLTKIHYDRKE